MTSRSSSQSRLWTTKTNHGGTHHGESYTHRRKSLNRARRRHTTLRRRRLRVWSRVGNDFATTDHRYGRTHTHTAASPSHRYTGKLNPRLRKIPLSPRTRTHTHTSIQTPTRVFTKPFPTAHPHPPAASVFFPYAFFSPGRSGRGKKKK